MTAKWAGAKTTLNTLVCLLKYAWSHIFEQFAHLRKSIFSIWFRGSAHTRRINTQKKVYKDFTNITGIHKNQLCANEISKGFLFCLREYNWIHAPCGTWEAVYVHYGHIIRQSLSQLPISSAWKRHFGKNMDTWLIITIQNAPFLWKWSDFCRTFNLQCHLAQKYRGNDSSEAFECDNYAVPTNAREKSVCSQRRRRGGISLALIHYPHSMSQAIVENQRNLEKHEPT